MRSANRPDSLPSPPPPPPVDHPSGQTATRLHHLDAVRAGALLLGIVLHSLLPFMPEGGWLFTDTQSSESLSVATFVIHMFRMALFMMLAGYFGRMVLHRRGAAAFVRDRLRRIGLPLLVFSPLMLVSIIAVVVAGTILGFLPEPVAAEEEQQDGLLALLNPVHLWFLLVLMEAILCTVAARAALIRMLGAERAAAWAERIGSALAAPAGVLIPAVPYALAVALQGTALFGILQPVTILPEISPTLAYFSAFLTGWFLHARAGAITRAGRRWGWQLPLAVVLTVPALFLAGASLVEGTGTLLAAAGLQGVTAWLWCFGLIGLAEKVLSRQSPAVRYLADASYWIYILHLPLLMAIGIVLAPHGLPILVKLLITWMVTMVILLLSYDLMVRSTWLGAWLNGRRHDRAIFRATAPAEART